MTSESNKSEAFRELLLEAIPRLRATAYVLSRDSAKSDDLVQDVLLKAWEKQDSLEDIENLMPWLFTILRNTFRASFRRKKFEGDMPSAEEELHATTAEQDLSCEVRDTLEAISELSPELREVIVLVCFQEMSYQEAADAGQCAIGTIKSRLNRARRELKSILGLVDVDNQFGSKDIGMMLQQVVPMYQTSHLSL